MTPTQHTLEQIALSWEEYRLACERLDREPNEVELGMIGALWSEHCGYKNLMRDEYPPFSMER